MTESPTATNCPLCDIHTIEADAERAMQACFACAKELGIVPMPPSRRPPLPCVRCKHMAFVRVIPREHTNDARGNPRAQVSAPMYVTYIPESYKAFVVNRVQPVAIDSAGVGMLETYICWNCGFVEWYCVDVDKIPVHPHLMTEHVDYAARSDGPYR